VLTSSGADPLLLSNLAEPMLPTMATEAKDGMCPGGDREKKKIEKICGQEEIEGGNAWGPTTTWCASAYPNNDI
jgi:hypothetical protein